MILLKIDVEVLVNFVNQTVEKKERVHPHSLSYATILTTLRVVCQSHFLQISKFVSLINFVNQTCAFRQELPRQEIFRFSFAVYEF